MTLSWKKCSKQFFTNNKWENFKRPSFFLVNCNDISHLVTQIQEMHAKFLDLYLSGRKSLFFS